MADGREPRRQYGRFRLRSHFVVRETLVSLAGLARRRWRLSAALLVAALLATAVAVWLEVHRFDDNNRLLLAPMIGGIDNCMIEPPDAGAEHDAHMKRDCRQSNGIGGGTCRGDLGRDRPRLSPGGSYELGYSLNVPLLQLLRRRGDDWRVDPELVARFVRTVRDTDRSVVLYLFGTHFSVRAPD